jgi:UDPglucose--hexose-1-phosphate uridylyltransferase
MNGEENPDFKETYIFENDFPALLQPNPVTVPANNNAATEDQDQDQDELFQTKPTFGSCKVLTYSPRHDLTLALMSLEEITAVVRCWRQVYEMEGKVIRDGHKVDKCGSLEKAEVEGLGDDVGCVNIFEVGPTARGVSVSTSR